VCTETKASKYENLARERSRPCVGFPSDLMRYKMLAALVGPGRRSEDLV